MTPILGGASLSRFVKDLRSEIKNDNVSNGAAALAYYLMLSIFPAAILLLSIVPYLPIHNIDRVLMGLLRQALPPDAANVFTSVVQQVSSERRGGLISVGALLTAWAASSGLYAIMQQLNITYDVKEARPFWKSRGTALLLTLLFYGLIIGSFALVVFGGDLEGWLAVRLGAGWALAAGLTVFRWVIIALALLLGFALVYYYGPDVEQRFRFISPGSVIGVILLGFASIGFRIYVANFGKYNATYGSLGAVIILLVWLYIAGWVLLLGSEVNALVEHYSPIGKRKGEKKEPDLAVRKEPGGGEFFPDRRPVPPKSPTPTPRHPQ